MEKDWPQPANATATAPQAALEVLTAVCGNEFMGSIMPKKQSGGKRFVLQRTSMAAGQRVKNSSIIPASSTGWS
jgi:hypothetical protein